MVRGSPKFDGMAVLEGSFTFLGAQNGLEGKAAFVNVQTGDTHGWTSNKQWSPEVIAKLKELRALMEVDLGRLHLDGGGDVLVTTSAAVEPRGMGGLGEHAGAIPSV
jgi:hypothetical protein